jgi:hypothetical protein
VVSFNDNLYQSCVESREGRSDGVENSIMTTDSYSVRVTKPGDAVLRRANAVTFPTKEDAHGVCHRGARGGEGGAGKQFPHPVQDQLRRLGGDDVCHAAGKHDLWDAVNIGTMDFTEDHMALEALTRDVPPELSGTITGKATTHIA